MNDAQNDSDSSETNSILETFSYESPPQLTDIPLHDLPRAHLREQNEGNILEGGLEISEAIEISEALEASETHRAPDRTPEALDERLYDDLCRGV
jgi:hypothetical protein